MKPVDPVDNLVQTAIFRRDVCMKCLSWGIAAAVFVVGFSVSTGEAFSWRSQEPDKWWAATYLTASTVVIGLVWVTQTRSLYRWFESANAEIEPSARRIDMLPARLLFGASWGAFLYTLATVIGTCFADSEPPGT